MEKNTSLLNAAKEEVEFVKRHAEFLVRYGGRRRRVVVVVVVMVVVLKDEALTCITIPSLFIKRSVPLLPLHHHCYHHHNYDYHYWCPLTLAF